MGCHSAIAADMVGWKGAGTPLLKTGDPLLVFEWPGKRCNLSSPTDLLCGFLISGLRLPVCPADTLSMDLLIYPE